MLANIPKNNEEIEMHLRLKMRNIRNDAETLTRYHCFVKRGSFMLMSISLRSLYPRFFRLNPSCCKAIFTWNDNTSILPEYQPEHPSSGIHFHEFKFHLYIRCFFKKAEAKFISHIHFIVIFQEHLRLLVPNKKAWWWLKASFLKIKIKWRKAFSRKVRW